MLNDEETMLTTIDNPFNPFTNLQAWQQYDEHYLHYQTCQKLALKADISVDFPDLYNEMCIDDAMKEIVKEDTLGVYRIVKASDYDDQGRLKTD